MKATGIIRKMDELGRIVVPKEIRTNFGIFCDDPVEIFVEDDRIILQKYIPNCIFCGGSEGVSEFKGKRMCKSCVEELTAKAAE